jgi:hypothetical protein
MLSYTITAVNCSCRTNPVYDEQLRKKVHEDRAKHGKKRFKPKDDDDDDEVEFPHRQHHRLVKIERINPADIASYQFLHHGVFTLRKPCSLLDFS